jgi:zinc protease
MYCKNAGLILAMAVMLNSFEADAAKQPAPEKSLLTPTAVVEGITEYKLSNGLRVLLAPDATKPTTTINITYLVGSRHESYGETGMAHLLEHMMFKGTSKRQDIVRELHAKSMKFNGTTSYDRTNFYESFTASEEKLNWALEMEADRMLGSRISAKDLASEFSVVRNEMEGGENNPERALSKQLEAISFDWHNYGHNTIGAKSDVEKVKVQNLQKFYKKYYRPDNAVLMISGKFDSGSTLGVVRSLFGSIQVAAEKPALTWTREPQREGAREVSLERLGNVQLAALLYPIAAGPHPDIAAISALNLILANSSNSRLQKALVETGKAVDVQGKVMALAEPGYMTFIAQLAPNQKLPDAKQTMIEAVEGMSSNGVTEEELKSAKAGLRNNFVAIMNDPQRLSLAISEYIGQGDWRLFFVQRDRIEKLTSADVQNVARNYLKRSNRSFGEYVSVRQADRAQIPETPDVGAIVAAYSGRASVEQGEDFDISPANIDKRTVRSVLQGGTKLALLSKKNRGTTVKGVVILRLGNEQGLFEKAAVLRLTSEMLLHGTDAMSRSQLAERLNALGAELSIRNAGQNVIVQFDTNKQNLTDVLDLVGSVLRTPKFDELELARLVEESVARIEAQRSNPSSIANLEASREKNFLYKKGDIRYRSNFEESILDLRSVKVGNVREFHRDFFGAEFADIALVGDFDVPETTEILSKIFGEWKARKSYAWMSELQGNEAGKSKLISTPDKANAYYLAKFDVALRDDDSDYVALLTANKIFGGSIRSRLVNRLRHKDGISYSAGSQLSVSSYDRAASLILFATYAPSNLMKLKQDVYEEIKEFFEGGITVDELNDAKKALNFERVMGRSQDGVLAYGLASQLDLKRTMRFSAEVDEKIEKLTVKEVNAAIRKYFEQGNFSHYYVGNFGADLTSANISEVTK